MERDYGVLDDDHREKDTSTFLVNVSGDDYLAASEDRTRSHNIRAVFNPKPGLELLLTSIHPDVGSN